MPLPSTDPQLSHHSGVFLVRTTATHGGEKRMMMPQSGGSLDLGLSLGLSSQGSLSSSTTSGALSPWAAALSSVGETPPHLPRTSRERSRHADRRVC